MSKHISTSSEDSELVEITEHEFLKYIAKTLDTLDDQQAIIDSTRLQFNRLYRDYLIDKDHSCLKFYLQGTTLMYEPGKSSKIGYKFNLGDEKK